jgi:hypothetical protein
MDIPVARYQPVADVLHHLVLIPFSKIVKENGSVTFPQLLNIVAWSAYAMDVGRLIMLEVRLT